MEDFDEEGYIYGSDLEEEQEEYEDYMSLYGMSNADFY